MKPRFWFEFHDRRKVFFFAAITAVIFIYWSCLVPGSLERISHDKRKLIVTINLHYAWFFGWAIALFGKAQDLNIITDYDFDRLRRLGSNALITISCLGFAVIFVLVKLRG